MWVQQDQAQCLSSRYCLIVSDQLQLDLKLGAMGDGYGGPPPSSYIADLSKRMLQPSVRCIQEKNQDRAIVLLEEGQAYQCAKAVSNYRGLG